MTGSFKSLKFALRCPVGRKKGKGKSYGEEKKRKEGQLRHQRGKKEGRGNLREKKKEEGAGGGKRKALPGRIRKFLVWHGKREGGYT